MEFQSLINKNTISPKGFTDFFRNLMDTTWRFVQDLQPKYIKHEVVEGEQMRPDLIAQKYYGDVDLVDGLLKFNDISAWWSIDVGDILLIPAEGYLSRCYIRPVSSERRDLQNELVINFTDPSKKSKKDQSRIDFLRRKASKRKRGAENILPTTLVTNVNENKERTEKGTIILK